MITSNNYILSDHQALTATALSTNVIDLGEAGTPFRGQGPLHQDIGKGTMVPLLISVTSPFVGATGLDVEIIVSANEDLSSPTVLLTESFTAAQLADTETTTNTQCIPNGADQRYLGLRYVVSGTATAGTIYSSIVKGTQTNFTGA